ncbi:MAG: molybdopterin molybdotransferase MoeA [Pseudomonadota bacterium]
MTTLISVDEAIALILEHRPQMPAETVRLDDALGRTLASPVEARLTQPPAPLSAMDGYAVRLADVSEPGAQLTVIGESPAGRPFEGPVSAGEAVRIFTGGYVPEGADHIVIQETASRDGDTITCADAHPTTRHIRAAGRDFSTGDVLIRAGTRLGPAEIAVAAAANHAELTVRQRPKVALITNGNELKPPGTDIRPGEIVSSNPYAIGALVKIWGGELLQTEHSADTVASIQNALSSASAADIIVPIGGASVGDHDHMRQAFDQAGFASVFQKIAVRPGKPTWFAKNGAQVVLGLPGNPASAYVCAHLFLKVLLGTVDGLKTQTARLTTPLAANGSRETFMRAHLVADEDGGLSVTPAADQDSSLLTPFLLRSVLIRQHTNAKATPKGAEVEIQLIKQ